MLISANTIYYKSFLTKKNSTYKTSQIIKIRQIKQDLSNLEKKLQLR